ncbi:hypothetical protein D3C81_1916850 [compost metagenome]
MDRAQGVLVKLQHGHAVLPQIDIQAPQLGQIEGVLFPVGQAEQEVSADLLLIIHPAIAGCIQQPDQGFQRLGEHRALFRVPAFILRHACGNGLFYLGFLACAAGALDVVCRALERESSCAAVSHVYLLILADG